MMEEGPVAPGAPPRPPVAQGRPPQAMPTPFPEIWKQFSGEKAFAHVRRLVEFGPHPAGSKVIEEVRGYLTAQLEQAGWKVERQEFTDLTPHGSIAYVNLIARFGGSAETQRVIVGSHYDTKVFSTIRFVGANDGGSSTGALLELARVLTLDPAMAVGVELVLFDGEEAVSQFTLTDGLYGSRHFAKVLAETKRAGQFQQAIIWDMIGDKDLTITLPSDTPPDLARAFFTSAEALGVRDLFRYHSTAILDDHVPLQRIGIPAIDLIDFDFIYWHTADDTLDKVSAASLRTVGAVTLHHLRELLK